MTQEEASLSCWIALGAVEKPGVQIARADMWSHAFCILIRLCQTDASHYDAADYQDTPF